MLRPVALLSLLACGVLIAGCGSSSSSSSASSSGSSTAQPSTTSTAPATTSTGGAAKSQSSQAVLAACRQTLAAQTSLPARIKAKLEAACAKYAAGDTSALKQATRELCEEVIKSSAVAAGPAKERALAACKAK